MVKPFINTLPPELRARGWRIWAPDGAHDVRHAVRLDGPPSAPFSAACHFNFHGWDGYSEGVGRTLRDPAPTLTLAIEWLEQAESEGLFSPLWREATPPPIRPGWSHRVRAGRDEWHAVTDAPYLVLSVMHLRPTEIYRGHGPYGGSLKGMRFAALVHGVPLTYVEQGPSTATVNWDALTMFDDVPSAMWSAESEAARQHVETGINRPVRLLDCDTAWRDAIIEEVG